MSNTRQIMRHHVYHIFFLLSLLGIGWTREGRAASPCAHEDYIFSPFTEHEDSSLDHLDVPSVNPLNSPLSPSIDQPAMTPSEFTIPKDPSQFSHNDPCLIFLDQLIANPSTETSGSGVDYGTGLIESYFAHALINMEALINFSLAKNPSWKDKDIKILKMISKNMDHELQTKPLIIFKKTDASFTINGKPRIAYTKTSVGSPIFINKDLIYLKKDKVLAPAINYQIIVQILVHEFGHHHGELDHDYLSEIGAVVAEYSRYSEQTTLLNAGFESSSPWGWPAHWLRGSANYSYSYVDNRVAAEGLNSLMMNGTNIYSSNSIYQCINLPENSYSALRFSALLMPAMANYSFAAPMIYVYGKTGNLESFADGFNIMMNGQSGFYNMSVYGQLPWQYRHVQLPLAKSSVTLCMGFYQQGFGNTWIDNVRIEFF